MRVELQPAYILHTRPFRENSLLVDALTQDHGRIALVARAVRSVKFNQRYYLQPFIPLRISWLGNTSLKTLTNIDPSDPATVLTGTYLYSGFYINELLMQLLLPESPVHDIYHAYKKLLVNLENNQPLEFSLRYFEFYLLDMLGYGIDFNACADSGCPIESDNTYYFVPDHGLLESTHQLETAYLSISGQYLLAIGANDFIDIEVRRAAKKLSRFAFEHLLQGKTLKSRELFRAINKTSSASQV
ncbi:MAG: DNA repair protein RecO (recombination protein O) [Cellvibrionaceae bacterium]|jgi:DNA repair protein RecO (recombination protein O)